MRCSSFLNCHNVNWLFVPVRQTFCYSVAQPQPIICSRGPHLLTQGSLWHMWQPLVSRVPAFPPKYGHPSSTFGGCYGIGWRGRACDSHLACGPWVIPGCEVASEQYGRALVYYIPLTPQAFSLNINGQTSHPLPQTICWHLKTPRNASQDPDTPLTHPVALPGPTSSVMWSVWLYQEGKIKRSIWRWRPTDTCALDSLSSESLVITVTVLWFTVYSRSLVLKFQ